METIRADLHNHLRTSDRLYGGDFNQAIDLARKRLGVSPAIGIVNFSDRRYEEFSGLPGYDRAFVGEGKRAFYVRKPGVLVVKGQEVPTKEGHVLAFGLPSGVHLKDNCTLEDTLKEAEDNGAAVIADHPFYLSGIGKTLERNPELLSKFDALEVHNGEAAAFCMPFPGVANRKAQRFYDKFKKDFPHLGAISSSDGHSMYELGSSYTVMLKPDLTSDETFAKTFKDSVRRCRSKLIHQKTNSFVGGVDHMADLAVIIGALKAGRYVPAIKSLVPRSQIYGANKPQESECPIESSGETIATDESPAGASTTPLTRQPSESFEAYLARKRKETAEFLRSIRKD